MAKLNDFLASFEESNGEDIKEKVEKTSQNSFNIKEENTKETECNRDTKQKIIVNTEGRPITRRKLGENDKNFKNPVQEIEKEIKKETQNPKQVLKLNKPKLNLNKNIKKQPEIIADNDNSFNNEEDFLIKIRKSKESIEQDLKEFQAEEKRNQRAEMLEHQTEKPKTEDVLEELFIKSGTPVIFKEKWYALYEKAMASDKNTQINGKVRRGKFRFAKDGTLEILPEHETAGKSALDLLHEQWKIN